MIPAHPYCTDDAAAGLKIRSVRHALRYRLVQYNGPYAYGWLLFDIDRAGAYYAADDANLLPPNIVIVNRANRHAHLAYRLRTPVANFAASRVSPLHYLAAVERGMVRRLDADRHYCGLIGKNPLHESWYTEWQAPTAYALDDLADCLFAEDTRPWPKTMETSGLGRNCATFDELRAIAYREVLRMKRSGATEEQFRLRLQEVAAGINRQFAQPMHLGEIRSIARSVSRWTWRRFSNERFSAIQRYRAQSATRRHLAVVAELKHVSP